MIPLISDESADFFWQSVKHKISDIEHSEVHAKVPMMVAEMKRRTELLRRSLDAVRFGWGITCAMFGDVDARMSWPHIQELISDLEKEVRNV